MRSFARRAYASLPFKRQILHVIRSVGSPPWDVYRHLHFEGPFTVRPAGGVPFTMIHHGHSLENDVFWNGPEGHEPLALGIWMRLAQNVGAAAVLDIGANTGYFALLAASMSTSSRIVAMEAIERVGLKAQQNVDANEGWGDRVHVLRVGASDQDGVANIFAPKTDHLYTATIGSNALLADKDVESVEIQVRSVDSVVEELEIERVGLVKIDVETYEPVVLDGMVGVLHRDKPAIIIEVLNEAVAEEVEKRIGGFGYRRFALDETTSRVFEIDQMTSRFSRNVLLCQPADASRLSVD